MKDNFLTPGQLIHTRIVRFHPRWRVALLGAAFFVTASLAQATPMVFAGADTGNAVTTNSDAAFANWVAAATPYSLDNIDGTSSTGGPFGTRISTSLGNVFEAAPDDLFGVSNFPSGVLQGDNLSLTRQGTEASFRWDIVEAATALGFFSRNNDGGVVTVAFMDGTTETFTAAPNNGPGDNLFWGITNLASAATSVTISTTDPGAAANGATSRWDRFVYAAASPVPEPGTAFLFGAAACLAAFSQRRRR